MKARLEKEAEEKRVADEKAEQERKAELVASKKKARLERSKAKDKRDYVPEKGTGKMFHVKMEQLRFQKHKKLSSPVVQIMEFPAFLIWLKNAGGLGYAFGIVHDPLVFFADKQKEQVRKSLKEYVKRIPFDTLDYAKDNLITDEGYVNEQVAYMYGKKKAKIEEEMKAKAKDQDDYLD